jgi:adenylate cyclase
VLKTSLEVLSGQKYEASILFSGMRRLSPLSDNLPPTKFLDLMNRYFLNMTSLATKKGGINFNIEGDALLAGWGVPAPKKKDSIHALHTALLMIGEVQKINEENDTLGLPPLEIGIGLDSGPVTAGNIASSNKVDWAVMGSPVTLAVQLQDLTKKYHEAILFTENVYKKVYSIFPCRFVDKAALKGQPSGVSLFTARLKIEGKEKDAWKHHRIGVKLFYARKFPEAQLQFEQALIANPEDGLSAIYIKRCGAFIKNPPPPLWDGKMSY